MKLIQQKQVEIEAVDDKFEIEDVVIGDNIYSLIIYNDGGCRKEANELYVRFINQKNKNWEFSIQIRNDNTIRMSKMVYRPNHDHNDIGEKEVDFKFGAEKYDY